MTKQRGLGKGLGALLGEAALQTAEPPSGAQLLPLQKVEPNPLQPRKNFDPDELKAAVAYAHAHNVRVHCTINTMPRGDEIVRLPAHLERLNDAGVDAVIVADLGAFTLAGKYAPNCQRHISTQASISNYVTANAWYDLGASRVILARELSLEEIRTIRENTPAELEIEAFVHGAMCMSVSGRCLLSNYMAGRDANPGRWAPPCRQKDDLGPCTRPGQLYKIGGNGNRTDRRHAS